MKPIDINEEYRKNKDLKKADVKSLLTWIETQPHLPKIKELDVILFLHSCYYDEEKAKHTIDTYYTCRTHSPEMFENWNVFDANIQKAMEVIYVKLLNSEEATDHKLLEIKYFL